MPDGASSAETRNIGRPSSNSCWEDPRMTTTSFWLAGAVGIGLGLAAIYPAAPALARACLNPDLPMLSLTWQNSTDGYFNVLKLGNRCADDTEAVIVEDTVDFEPVLS